MRSINEIILHCSATKRSSNIKAIDIDRWHKAKNWKGCGYHYVIDVDGTIEQGRVDDEVGAHCQGRNKHSIGICYSGGLDEKTEKPKDTRTDEQKTSMYRLVRELLEKYHLSIFDVHCHNEYAAKACPCFDINKFRDEYLLWYYDEIDKELKEKNKRIPLVYIKDWWKQQ